MRTMSELTPKTVAESRVELTQLMEATDVNIAGSVHGGVVMRLVDTAAGLAAIRHAAGLAVTVAIDELSFLEPVHILRNVHRPAEALPSPERGGSARKHPALRRTIW